MRILLTILVLSLFFVNFSIAQNGDAELWTGIELQKRLAKGLSLRLEEEVRINDNISDVKSVFTQVGVTYRFNKYFRTKITYRLGNQPALNGPGPFNRFMTDFTFRYKKKPFIFFLRGRYQNHVSEMNVDYTARDRDIHWRTRLMVKIDLDKAVQPYIGSEFYNQLNNPKGNVADTYRFYLGIEYRMARNQEVKLGYILEKPMNPVRNQLTAHIWAINYSFVIPKWRTDKKETPKNQ